MASENESTDNSLLTKRIRTHIDSTSSSSLTEESPVKRSNSDTPTSPLRLHQPSRGRGRPSKAELLERDKGRHKQLLQLYEERGDHYSLILVSLNNKLALMQNSNRKRQQNLIKLK